MMGAADTAITVWFIAAERLAGEVLRRAAALAYAAAYDGMIISVDTITLPGCTLTILVLLKVVPK